MPYIIIRSKIEANKVDGIVVEKETTIIPLVGNITYKENATSLPYHYEFNIYTSHINGSNNEDLYTYYQKILSVAQKLGLEKLLICTKSYGFEMAKMAVKEFLKDNEMTIYVLCSEQILNKTNVLDSKLSQYIEQHYTPPVYKPSNNIASQNNQMPPSFMIKASNQSRPLSLNDALNQMEESFSEMLLRLIDESGMSDAECYKKANIDRKLFSKIRSDRLYRPSKITVLSFAIALELSLDDTNEMLKSAGYALSHSNKFDVIVEFFISQGNYDVYEINDALFEHQQNLLGV